MRATEFVHYINSNDYTFEDLLKYSLNYNL